MWGPKCQTESAKAMGFARSCIDRHVNGKQRKQITGDHKQAM